jgi:hypothetical protein
MSMTIISTMTARSALPTLLEIEISMSITIISTIAA